MELNWISGQPNEMHILLKNCDRQYTAISKETGDLELKLRNGSSKISIGTYYNIIAVNRVIEAIERTRIEE